MMSKRPCEQDKTVVIFSDLGPDLVAMYMAIYKDWLRARLRLREYFRVVMREFRDAIGGCELVEELFDDRRCVQPSYWCHNKPTGYGVNGA